MGPIGAVKSGFAKRIDFESRATRSELWWWPLFILFGTFVLFLAMGAVGAAVERYRYDDYVFIGFVLLLIALILPGFALTARRLHDVNRSGWWMFIAIIPVIGWLLFLFWMLKRGTRGDNRFGPDPLAQAAPAIAPLEEPAQA